MASKQESFKVKTAWESDSGSVKRNKDFEKGVNRGFKSDADLTRDAHSSNKKRYPKEYEDRKTSYEEHVSENSSDDSDGDDGNAQIHPVISVISTENDFSLSYFDLLKQPQSDSMKFIQQVAPVNKKIRCKVIVKRGIINEYTFFLEKFNTGKDLALMSTRRKKMSTGIAYTIIGQNEFKEPTKFGFVESNIIRKTFTLYGDVFNNPRRELILSQGIQYFDMTIINRLLCRIQPLKVKLDMNIFARDTERDKKVVYKSKKPNYDKKSHKYTLDFENRARLRTRFSLQILDGDQSSNIIFQLCKLNSRIYAVDFSYPFCAFSAFGLAISILARY